MVAIILAGGKGKRMNSSLPKVLHKVCGKPMIIQIIKQLRSLKQIEKIVVIVGYKKQMVKKVLPDDVLTAVQKKMLGTADAVKSARQRLKNYKGDCLIVCGDTPLITAKTIGAIIKKHKNRKSDVTIVTTHVKKPTGYGRIIRNSKRKVLGIMEEKDAGLKEKKIKEINSGIYCYNWEKLDFALNKIKKNKIKGEYYLTDAIALFLKHGFKIDAFLVKNPSEVIGVDTKERLKDAEAFLERRKNGYQPKIKNI